MSKYLWHGSYSVDGINGVHKEGGTARVAAVRRLVEGLGGSLESFYFGLGKDDYWITVDLPGNVEVAAAALTVAATGAASVQTVALLTPEEIDRAVKLSATYRKPGA